MKAGRVGVASGLMTELQVMFGDVSPETVLAKMRHRLAEPGGDA
jgi:Mg2+/Co2+ transporter CorB